MERHSHIQQLRSENAKNHELILNAEDSYLSLLQKK